MTWLDDLGPRLPIVWRRLSKDTRLPEAQREAAYLQQLIAGDWRVAICKLADCYDNLSDFSALPAAGQAKQIAKVSEYLEALRPQIPSQALVAFDIVDAMTIQLKNRPTHSAE